MILCAVPRRITLGVLSDVMLELGAWNAINMDGGSMCAFCANGKPSLEPVKPVSNILVVYKRK